MTTPLLVPREVDRILRYPRGRSLRYAKAGKMPHVVLPDGEIRFRESDLQELIRREPTAPTSVGAEEDSHAS